MNPYVDTPTTPTVTFNLNYVGCGEAKNLSVGDGNRLASLPDEPVRENYAFLGWFTENLGGSLISAETVFAESTEVYAHWAHTEHTWAYKAVGGTIYAYCTKTDGECSDGCYFTAESCTDSTVKYTISASDSVYNGSAVTVTVEDGFSGTTATVPTVTYYTDETCTAQTTAEGSGASAAGGAPENVGSYWATANVGDAVAKVSFKITPAAQNATVSMGGGGYTYGGTLGTPSADDVQENAVPTYYCNTENSNSGGKPWAGVTSETLSVGTYYIYAELPATKNYAKYTTAAVAFTVSPKQVPDGAVKVTPHNAEYDGQEHAAVSVTVDAAKMPDASVSYSLTAEGEYTPAVPKVKNASDSKTVYYKVTTPNFETVSGSAAATVSKRPINILAGSITIAEKTYDGTKTAEVTVSDLAGVNSETIRISGITGTFDSADAGSRTVGIDSADPTVTVIGGTAGNYYITFPTDKTAEIKQREVGLTWGSTTFTYTGEAKTVTATPTNLVGTDVVELTYSGNTATAVGNYTATVTAISNANYKLPSNASTGYSISYLTPPDGVDAVLSGTVGQNGWYTSDAALTAPAGYQISASGTSGYEWKTSLTYSHEGEHSCGYQLRDTGTGGITAAMTRTVKVDKTAPAGDITVKTNSIKALLNTITFNRFFKNTAEVTISGTDATSGVAKIEYRIVPDGGTYDAGGTWTQYSGKFSVSANDRSVYYARITDNAGLQTVFNSDGVVVYRDASAGAAHTYVLSRNDDLATDIAVNGSSIASVKENETSVSDANYTVNDEGKLVLKGDYLHTLSAGSHTLTVEYNPLGIPYAAMSGNDAPGSSTVTLTIEKGEQKVTFDIESFTYGETEIPTAESVKDNAQVTFYYYPEGGTKETALVWNASETLPAGTYYVFASVAETVNYEAYTTDAKPVTIAPTGQTPPPAPSLHSRTKHEIILNTIAPNAAGNPAEYSIDGGHWQSSPRFENLATETAYTFRARYAASQNYRQSPASEATLSTVSRSGVAFGTVHIYAGEHGSAAPSGTVNVRSGEDRTITFTPDAGYEVGDVVVNHKSVGAVREYTAENIDGTVNIEVTFVRTGNGVIAADANPDNPATGSAL